MTSPTRVRPGFDRAAWSGLATTSLLHSGEWLEVMAGRLPGTVHTFVHGRVGLLGAVVDDPEAYETFNPHALLFGDPPVFELAGAARRAQRLARIDPGVVLPALVLATPGYLGDPAGVAADHERLAEAVSGIAGWGREQGLRTLCCLYTDEATAAVAEAFARLGGVSFPLTTRWVLPVWWDGWDSYLAGFGPSRRRKIRRELDAAEAAGVRPARIDPREHLGAIVDGRCATLAAYGHAPDPGTERARLEGLLDTFGSRLTGYGAVRGRDLAGSILCVEHERTVHVLYSSTTEEGLRLPFTHFVAAYYAPARHVTSREVDRVDYGIAHGSAKAHRGCRPAVLHGHAAALDPAAAEPIAAAAGLLREAWTAPAEAGGPPHAATAEPQQRGEEPRRAHARSPDQAPAAPGPPTARTPA